MEENPNTRLMAFSDGVIAVAITLLVLDIRLPEGFANLDDAGLWAALLELRPRFLAYLISFAVIGTYWVNHHAKFSHIVKSDIGLMWINLVFLLTIGLVPFTTDLIAENSGLLGTAIYALTMVVSGLSLAWIWGHAHRSGLLDPDLSEDERKRQLRTTLISSAVFVISVPFGFAHPDLAKYFWLLLIPLTALRRLRADPPKKREKDPATGSQR